MSLVQHVFNACTLHKFLAARKCLIVVRIFVRRLLGACISMTLIRGFLLFLYYESLIIIFTFNHKKTWVKQGNYHYLANIIFWRPMLEYIFNDGRKTSKIETFQTIGWVSILKKLDNVITLTVKWQSLIAPPTIDPVVHKPYIS